VAAASAAVVVVASAANVISHIKNDITKKLEINMKIFLNQTIL
jgi:hypothetical protein